MIASENPRGSEQLKIEQLHTQLRQAKRSRQSLYQRITAGADFGPQDKRRPVSTDQRATELDRALVRRVLAGTAPQPRFLSATKFFEPAVQNAAFALAEQARRKQSSGGSLTDRERRLLGYERDADAVRATWRADGDTAVGTLEGVEFWT